MTQNEAQLTHMDLPYEAFMPYAGTNIQERGQEGVKGMMKVGRQGYLPPGQSARRKIKDQQISQPGKI